MNSRLRQHFMPFVFVVFTATSVTGQASLEPQSIVIYQEDCSELDEFWEGDHIDMMVTIRNSADTDSAPATLRLYLSPDDRHDASDYLMCTRNSNRVSAKSTWSVRCGPVPLPHLSDGNYTLHVLISLTVGEETHMYVLDHRLQGHDSQHIYERDGVHYADQACNYYPVIWRDMQSNAIEIGAIVVVPDSVCITRCFGNSPCAPDSLKARLYLGRDGGFSEVYKSLCSEPDDWTEYLAAEVRLSGIPPQSDKGVVPLDFAHATVDIPGQEEYRVEAFRFCWLHQDDFCPGGSWAESSLQFRVYGSVVPPIGEVRPVSIGDNLQSVIDSSSDGDVIVLDPGRYVIAESLRFGGRRVSMISLEGPDVTEIHVDGGPPWGAVLAFLEGDSVTIEGLTLTGGTAANPHNEFIPLNAIYCEDAGVVLRDCVIRDNEAGILCRGGASISLWNCVLDENGDKAVYAEDESAVLMTNCLISRNHRGVIASERARCGVRNCTVVGNGGYGIEAGDDSTIDVSSSVVWGNLTGSVGDGAGIQVDVEWSCVEGDSVYEGVGNINDDPLFVAMCEWNDNGSPDITWDDFCENGDFILRANSPCRDAGDCEFAPPADILGTERPHGSGCDMGAYECTEPVAFRRGDVNQSGRLEITDAILILDYLVGGSQLAAGERTRTSCLVAMNVNGDTEKGVRSVEDERDIDLTDPIVLLQYVFDTVLDPPPPAAPFPDCGFAESEVADPVACFSFTCQ